MSDPDPNLDSDLEPPPAPLLPPLGPEIPDSRKEWLLELATDRILQDGLSSAEAAAEFKVDPDDLHRWARATRLQKERQKQGGSQAATEKTATPQTNEKTVVKPSPLTNSETSELFPVPRKIYHSKPQPKLILKPEDDHTHPWESTEAENSDAPSETTGTDPSDAFRRLLDHKLRTGIITLLALSAAIASLVLIANRDAEPAPLPAAEPAAPVKFSSPTAEDSSRAEAIARAFLAADGLEAKLQFVRNPDRARPRMTDWYLTRNHSAAAQPLGPTFRSALGTLIGDTPFVVLEAASEDPLFPIVFAIDVSGDDPKVDWESHVLYQPMPWSEFKRLRPTESLPFRVRATPSNELLAPFDNPDKWISLRLTSPRNIVGLIGYADRSSALALHLKHLFQYGGKKQLNLIAHLRFPDNDEGNPAVEITKATEGWIEMP